MKENMSWGSIYISDVMFNELLMATPSELRATRKRAESCEGGSDVGVVSLLRHLTTQFASPAKEQPHVKQGRARGSWWSHDPSRSSSENLKYGMFQNRQFYQQLLYF